MFLMALIATSSIATALELVSDVPIPQMISLQLVARVMSQTEIVSSA